MSIESLEQNPCLSQCNGACCKDLMFFNVPKEDLDKLTPPSIRAIELIGNTPSEIYDSLPVPIGVYYSKNLNNSYDLVISGSCGNLKTDGSCAIYETRPEACRELEVRSSECVAARKNIGLRPLQPLISMKMK